MEALLHTASFFAAMAVSALASAVWEGAVLAACVYFCLQMFPTLSAAARSVVWLNVFVLLVLLQFVPAMGPQVSAGNALRPAPFELDLGWSFAIAGAWGILSLLRAVQLIWSAIRSSGLAQRATAIDAGDALLALLEVRAAGPKLSRSGKISRVAELCLSDEVERPSVFGFFHPRILLPAALMERLTPQELEQVVVHEMEHLRRSDDWTNLFQKIALMVFPLNPALLWVERRLCAERELACDDSVLRASRGRKAYALCLTRLAEYSMVRRSLSLVLGAWERQSELAQRVHRILRRPVATMRGRQSIVVTACLMAAVLTGGAALARSPRLVSFVPHAPDAAQAQLLPAANLQEGRAEQRSEQSGMKAEMVKAIMPQPSLHGLSAARPLRTNAILRAPKQRPVAQPQTWVVLADWSDAVAAPQLVFAVQRSIRVSPMEDPNQSPDQGPRRGPANQPRYAAVPFANGWLIVQI
jgi:beta-lactamase regulating signal transducer with metallopeptidase domain